MTKETWFKEGTYYARNRGKLLRAQKKRYHDQTDPHATTPWTPMLCNAKLRAAKKGIEFNLDSEWAEARWTGKCEVTGIEFQSSRGRQGMGVYSASLDRIDNSRGYTKDNCRFVLGGINAFKLTGTDADMLRIALALVARMQPPQALDSV